MVLRKFPGERALLCLKTISFVRSLLRWSLSDSKEDLLFNLVVEIVEGAVCIRLLTMLSQVILQLLELVEDVVLEFCSVSIWSLKHRREETLDDCSGDLSLFADIETTLEHKHVWYSQEDLGITALNLLFELLVLFTSALDQLTQTDELLALISWYKMSSA